MTDQLIPFGKYKGQPLEAIKDDHQYLDWLMAQSWVRDRYPSFYTIIVNNFQEPSDTPEHNAMHVRFLNDAYAYSLLAPLVSIGEGGVITEKKFEASGWDLFIAICSVTDERFKETLKEDDRLQRLIDGHESPENGKPSYKDQMKMLWEPVKSAGFYIEIKPTISDDFPSVLRQVKSFKRNLAHNLDCTKIVLFVGQYTGKGATRDEFVAFMANEGVTVIFDGE